MAVARTTGGSPGLLRSSVAAALCAVVTAGLAAIAAAQLRLDAGATVDGLVLAVVAGAGGLAGAVLTAGCSLLALSALCRRAGQTSRALEAAAARLTPAVLRRAVAITVGAGMGLAPTAAGATATPAPQPTPQVTATPPVTATPDLGWAVTTTPGPHAPSATAGAPPGSSPRTSVAPGGAVVTTVARTRPGQPPAGGEAQITVRVGDSLWSIAAAQIPDGACDADVAAAWPVLYERNRPTIGADPDHIHPGQVLVVPPLPVTTPASGPTDPSKDDR